MRTQRRLGGASRLGAHSYRRPTRLPHTQTSAFETVTQSSNNHSVYE
jgi:hypothetical protein